MESTTFFFFSILFSMFNIIEQDLRMETHFSQCLPQMGIEDLYDNIKSALMGKE